MPPLPLFWSQVGPPAEQVQLHPLIQWLLVWGETAITDARMGGAVITWLKVLGLFSLVAWILVGIVNTLRASSLERSQGASSIGWAAAFLAGFAGLFLVSVLVQVLEQTGRLRTIAVGPVTLGTAVSAVLGLILIAWVEWVLWRGLLRAGRRGPIVLATGLHLALALGLVVGFSLPTDLITTLFVLEGLWRPSAENMRPPGYLLGPTGKILQGLRLGATYAGLVVLAYIASLVFRELLALRWRRIWTIAWQTIIESYRRMWAPWVVLALFVIFLAFTNWFLRDQRTAELAKLYVNTISVVISLLLTLMVLILAPISIPNDIRQQTIYTVVSKPMRRLELIWGRLLGYMLLVTIVVLVFGSISLAYLDRVVARQVPATVDKAREALAAGRVEEARQLNDQAEQLKNRMSARVPLFGSLLFTDSKGTERAYGIDVGTEMTTRSHIEGATPSKATWRFGVVADPKQPDGQADTRLPIERLLRPGSIEEVENRLLIAADDLRMVEAEQQNPNLRGAETRRLSDRKAQLQRAVKELQAELEALRKQEADLLAAGRREEAQALHSPDVPFEMTFNIYRTTKGEVGELGEAVRASVVVTNPRRPDLEPARLLFPVREYYTIRQSFPASLLVGSRGDLQVVVQCVTPSQYLGMAEPDLYILASQGSFWGNYLRGLSGIWLQTLVLVSVGLFAGTFLSWPVALLLTLAFYLAGQMAIGFLNQLVTGASLGGGPFESMIRLVHHDNQMSDLNPTLGVVLAKTFDQIVMPFLSRLSYLIPNLSALDLSNQVALGFAIDGWTLLGNFLLGVGYALPFTIAAYFILKNREVAA